MKYEKPQAVLFESAVAAIQSGNIPKTLSNSDNSQKPSVAAYEADE
jgi:hypothetical protein